MVALVGRSNVGKSSLITALGQALVATTSGAPGKTQRANICHVTRGGGRPLYFVDLPEYGYARVGRDEFESITRAFFGPDRHDIAMLLLAYATHPARARDRAAWECAVQHCRFGAVVITKIDKLARSERQRAIRQCEAVLNHPCCRCRR